MIIKNDAINYFAYELENIKSEYKSGKNVNLILASVIELSVEVADQIRAVPPGQREETWVVLQYLLTPKWWQTDPVWQEVMNVGIKLLNRSRFY